MAPPLGMGAPPRAAVATPSALAWALADQQSMTAVERFSRHHDAAVSPPPLGGSKPRGGAAAGAIAETYRELIPFSAPGVGQQYAFEVDLDSCTGCKACVTGCHNLNGLDDGEIWRSVGLLHGGTEQAPARQTVTTSCHHCLEPACLQGCPVQAYEKDPVTGIVKHLDDQCIGCQYCVFMCPYDAPKYNPARGIVRKCDMCSDRLAHDEAPACVQSCPNQAIRITLVNRSDTIQATATNHFLAGAPTPRDTLPTTVYKTVRGLAPNLAPADRHLARPEHAHPPLVVMLTLTQLSVGAFVANPVANLFFSNVTSRSVQLANALVAVAVGILALAVMPAHLGRPRYAFRALLGLRTSWLSREILAFSIYAGTAIGFAATFFLPQLPAIARSATGCAGAAVGAAGVLCSVMVYAATRRFHWRGSLTGCKFGSSAVILGAATVILVSLLTSAAGGGGGGSGGGRGSGEVLGPTLAPPFVSSGGYRLLSVALVLATIITCAVDLAELRPHRPAPHGPAVNRATGLLLGPLLRWTVLRFAAGLLGGLVLPALGLAFARRSLAVPSGAFPLVGVCALAALSLLLCLGAELVGRFLFFAAAPASRMPGGLD
jgi:Fe-S-cluster-containing dehydrogenase component/DMSO reductase anchor subunit